MEGAKFLMAKLFLVIFCLCLSCVSSFTTSRRIYNGQNTFYLHAISSPQQLGEFKSLNIGDERRCVRLYDFSASDPIEYRCMWDVQKQLLHSQIDRLKAEFQKAEPEKQFLLPTDEFIRGDGICDFSDITKGDISAKGRDAIILLQHQPVFTLGTGSDEKYVKLDESKLQELGIDLVRIERGGEVTYHGPGQLTAYPIVDLRGYQQDIHWYMRALEEAIIIALKSVGVNGEREDDVTGVWVNNKKVAALGVKVRRWVTMHGLAVNVDKRSLGNFDGIVPCGLEGREVGCINDFLDDPISEIGRAHV